MTRSRRAALVLAAGLMGSMLLATSSRADVLGSARTTMDQLTPPTRAQIAAAGLALPFGSRKVKVRTTDGAFLADPGGLLEVDITWSGRGPYKGNIFGSVHDIDADGWCVRGFAWLDGDAERITRGDACPEGDAKRAQYGFSSTWRVLVRVCLVKVSKAGRLRRTQFSSCSRWT
jgi:hypothetical protein